MLTRAGIALALLCMVALVPSVVRAESDRERATRHVGRGISYYEIGKYGDAIEEFERAYVLYATDTLLFNLGQAHRKLDHCAEALSYYERFLERSPGSSLAKQVRALIPALRRACDLKFNKPTGVTPARDGAGDRRPAEPAPPPAPVPPPAPAMTVSAPPPAPAITSPSPAPATTIEESEPAPSDGSGDVLVHAGSSVGGLLSPGGQALAVGVTAGFDLHVGGLPCDLGATVQASTYGWSTHGLDGRSGVIGLLATTRWSWDAGGIDLRSEASAGLLVVSHLQPGNPIRERGAETTNVALAPATQGGLSWQRDLGAGWGLRLGATLLVAPLGVAGGIVGDLRLVAALELLP